MAAAMVHEPYMYTATGILGDKRDTMLSNELHLRSYLSPVESELGRSLRRGYTLPSESFRYGRPNAQRFGGTAEAMTGWNQSSNGFDSGKQLPFHRKEAEATERDFMALNRAAVNAGLVSAPEHYQFRATHDVRRKIHNEDSKRMGNTRRIPPTMVFGLATRPSTPVYELLEHKYQDRWLQERRSLELAKRRKDETKRNTSGKVYETRASLLRIHQEKVDPSPLWQMPRFSKSARPHLETFRSENAKSEAFKHHQSDCISRKGVFGHGIYESAKS